MTPAEALASNEPDLNLEWGPVLIWSGEPKILTAIRQEEIEALMELAIGRDVLEIGGAHGYSAIQMALAGAKHVISVDNHDGTTWLGNSWRIMDNNLQIFGVEDRVTIIARDAIQAMMDLKPETFGLVFIDGGTEFKEIYLEVALGITLVKPGGVIAIHDYGHTVYQDKKLVLDRIFPEGPDKLVTSLFIKHL